MESVVEATSLQTITVSDCLRQFRPILEKPQNLCSFEAMMPTVTKKKRKRTSKGRHKWTEQEELAILNYARELLLEGNGFEKPTGRDYYKQFQQRTTEKALIHMNTDKIAQHMKQIKNTYWAARKFLTNNGEGTLEITDCHQDGTVKTLEEKIKHTCKYYDRMDELLGDTDPFTFPCKIEKVVSENADCIMDGDDATGHEIINEVDATSSTCDEQSNEPEQIESPPESLEHAPKRPCNSPIKNTSSALDSEMCYRCIVDENRLDREKKFREENLRADLLTRNQELELKCKQLEFEKQKWKDEYNFKQKALEDAFRLQEMKFHREMELKELELNRDTEMKKLELMNKFELEKLKLQTKSE